jgi:hypothetical protein
MQMKIAIAGAAAAALLALGGCGRGEENPNQPSADERRALDNIAAKQDADAETIDTSPDSLVPAEGSAIDANAAAPANGAAVPAGNSNAANTAAPK